MDESLKDNIFTGLDPSISNPIRESYYGIADHMEDLLINLKKGVKANPKLKAEAVIAQKMRDAFNKLTIGKYL